MRCNYVLVVAAAFVIAPFAAQADGSVRLFSFPGSDRTGLNGINDHGIAVGAAIVFPDAYKFTLSVRTGELTLIDPPPEDFESFGPEGINNRGVIVGGVFDSDTNMSTAFIRQPDGSFSYFTHPDARSYSWAMAINEAGLVAGSHDFFPEGTEGFIYNTDTGQFINFLASPFTSPNGINRLGKVVGHVLIPADEDTCGGGPVSATGFIQYGFVRHQDGFITLFQVNGQSTYAGDIRDDGLIVGAVFDPVVNKDRIFTGRVRKEPCVFLNRARSKLIGRAGFQYVPRGINDNGRIVGIAIQSVGVDESIIYGFVTRAPAE
jgi:hypothetical protein